jgi:hypothetical protein
MRVRKTILSLYAALFAVGILTAPLHSRAADEDDSATKPAIENVAATDAPHQIPAKPCPVTKAHVDGTRHPVSGKKAGGDASNPADTVSSLTLNLEWRHNEHGDTGRTDTFGVRVQAKLGIAKPFFVLLEMPFLYAYNDQTTDSATNPDGAAPSKFGISDLRIRAFYLPYMKQTIGFSGFGISLDMFAPSGAEEYYLGSGNWTLAPGLLFEFTATKWLGIYPILSYSATFPLAGGDPLVQSISVQTYFVFRIPKHLFVQIIPDYAQVFSPDAEGTFNTEFILGWQPNKSGLQLRYLRQFVGDNGTIDQVRVAYNYFF